MQSKRSATKQQKERFQKLNELGCIACRKNGHWRQSEVHHIVEGRKRLGHDQTLPLCPWHHRGIPDNNLSIAVATEILGPSLAHSKREFVNTYGTEKDLLCDVNSLLEVEIVWPNVP